MTEPSLPLDAPLLPSKDDRTLGLVVHLSAFAGHLFPFAHIIVPLVIWLVKKDSSAFLDDQGKEAVNAQISFTIYMFVAAVLCLILIGFVLLVALWIADIVLVIVAAIAANEGKAYRYPYILRLIK